MGFEYEKEFLRRSIEELRAYIKSCKNVNVRERFLAEKLLELYEFQYFLLEYL